METIELTLAIITPALVLMIFITKLLWDLIQRTTKVETNVSMLITWVACLNGDMTTEKEFQTFLKKLKKVNKETFQD